MTDSLGRQRMRRITAASVRAMAADPSVRSRGGRLHRGRTPLALPVPHLHSADAGSGEGARGVADGIALRLRHSDDVQRRALCPEDPVERLVYEMLEQFRAESFAVLPGMLANLRERHERWSLSLVRKGTTDTDAGLLLLTVAQIGRARITGEPIPEVTEGLIESTRFALIPLLGDHLAGIRKHREMQETFAQHAIAIAERVAGLVAERTAHWQRGRAPDPRLAVLVDFDSANEETAPGAPTADAATATAGAGGYRVFTSSYDREERAESVVRPELLARYRERLDRRVADSAVPVGKMARRLHDLLAAPHDEDWRGRQEEGHLDAGALTRLVTSSTDRAVFRNRCHGRETDVGVTVLIDCSGSMKQHADSVAVLADVLARALDLAGIDAEVLGFTTVAWNGGRARREWQRAGRPRNPGRCNELRHLVFKDASRSWRRSRAGIAALGKQDLFRESVDGEAVEWAHRRAANRGEARKILLVLSDGGPVDTATGLLNDTDILDAHLAKVVAGVEDSGGVEIIGIGFGADVSAYYTRNRTVDPATSATVQLRAVLSALT